MKKILLPLLITPFRFRQKAEAKRTIFRQGRICLRHDKFFFGGKFLFQLYVLNAKDISTIVKALRITNIMTNTVFDFAAPGFIKI